MDELPPRVAALAICDPLTFLCAHDLTPTERWAARVIAVSKLCKSIPAIVITREDLSRILLAAA